MPSLTSVVASGICAVVLLPALAVVGLSAAASCSTPPTTEPGNDARAGVTVWDPGQVSNAAFIIETGAELGVSARGLQIAVAVAIQESSLRNVAHGDQAGPDSLGLFQQRAAWGTPAERMDPATATTFFLAGGRGGQPGLLDIPGWQLAPLAQVADAVQHSAHPHAYAAHEADAAALVAELAGTTENVDSASGSGPSCTASIPDGGNAGLPAGYVLPAGTSPTVQVAIGWALAQLGTPYSYGGDCTDAHSGDPARRCDCSSLVQQAYRAAGITLPRTTTAQVRSGTAIRVVDLLAGDLIFIPGLDGTASNPRHVGLYLGQGLIVHAPQTGRDVEITQLARWQDQIAGVRPIT